MVKGVNKHQGKGKRGDWGVVQLRGVGGVEGGREKGGEGTR